ncbi:LytR C-terminal domain-containing protein [Longivirga aurantiaca]|uniref:LytR C-terminal domain-containing protein n=1 Tax=Longivirga aurantiaca TaxID=1837743 RepID=A0ABW1T5Y6_9ACTN
MSMLSGTVIGPSGGGPRRRRPWATGLLVVLMMAVVFGGTYGAVVLLRGGGNEPGPGSSSSSTPDTCVTVTVTPGAALPEPATVTVNVYNATDRSGLARATADELKAREFGIGAVANDPLGKTVAGVAEIRYGESGLDNAKLLRFYAPKAKLVKDKRTDATVDLVLGEKWKAVAPQKAVDAALAKPVASPGPGCPTPSKPASGTASASPSATPSAS